MANNNSISVDTKSGSRSFNRFGLQLSQSLHMALELYDQINFLLILDHYDDITVFDLDSEPLAVSYYQVKTSDNIITIDSAIKEDWITKLYLQMSRPEEWIVKELGLITNTPLRVNFKILSKNGKEYIQNKDLDALKTPFTELYKTVQEKIKTDISKKCHIPREDVDLSKFAHLHTTLSIDRHQDIVEKEVGDFLYDKYPRITIDTVKGIYSSLILLLTRQQSNERMDQNASLEDVKISKGFSKDDLNRVIDKAITISIPSFEEVQRFSGVDPSVISLAYVTIMADSNNKSRDSFSKLFNTVVGVIKDNPYTADKTAWQYAIGIAEVLDSIDSILCIPYNNEYIAVLTICLMINETRKQKE